MNTTRDEKLRASKVIEVETMEQYENAFTEKTVMTNFFNAVEAPISREDWIRIAHKHGVPCFNDAAADVPPISNLWNYTQMGFDLVAFSGGKGMRGTSMYRFASRTKRFLSKSRA